jgi:hypothetical protein
MALVKTRRLELKISDACHASVQLTGNIYQADVDFLIEFLLLMKRSLPNEGRPDVLTGSAITTPDRPPVCE